MANISTPPFAPPGPSGRALPPQLDPLQGRFADSFDFAAAFEDIRAGAGPTHDSESSGESAEDTSGESEETAASPAISLADLPEEVQRIVAALFATERPGETMTAARLVSFLADPALRLSGPSAAGSGLPEQGQAPQSPAPQAALPADEKASLVPPGAQHRISMADSSAKPAPQGIAPALLPLAAHQPAEASPRALPDMGAVVPIPDASAANALRPLPFAQQTMAATGPQPRPPRSGVSLPPQPPTPGEEVPQSAAPRPAPSAPQVQDPVVISAPPAAASVLAAHHGPAANDPATVGLPHSPAPLSPTAHGPQASADLSGHVARQIAVTAPAAADQPVDLRLNPEELGQVRLSLRHGDGFIAVTIQAERGETLDLMRRHIALLENEFRDLGYSDIQFSFGSSGQGRNQPPSAPPPGNTGENPSSEDTPPTDSQPPVPNAPAAARQADASGLDLRF